MEQYSKRQQEYSSSSDELEIEQNIPTKQPTKQIDKLDIRDFLVEGEFLHHYVNQSWLSVEVLQVQQNSLLVLENEQTKWLEWDFMLLKKQWIPGVKPMEGERLDIKNKHQGWMVATVVSVKLNMMEGNNYFDFINQVHYNGYKQCYDELIPFPSELVQPLGSKTRECGMGWLLNRQPQLLNLFITRYHTYVQCGSIYAIQRLYARLEASFPEVLKERGLCIKEVAGDGNCMFRAISDQLYGTEVYHNQLRKYALEYILNEREFYQNFVEGGNLDNYVENKMQDGVWGDNLELQAFRELYGIPIEIYVYSSHALKTGLEHNPNLKEPIRLSYHGRSHYNSLKPINNLQKALIHTSIGEMEMCSIEKVKPNEHNIQMSGIRQESLLKRPNLLEDVFNESHKTFEEEMKKKDSEMIQTTIEESIKQSYREEDEGQLLDMVIKQSESEAQLQIEEQIISNVLKESEENQSIDDNNLKRALEESIYGDPLQNPIIAQIVQNHQYFTMECILEAYAVCNGDPEGIVNYLYDHQFS